MTSIRLRWSLVAAVGLGVTMASAQMPDPPGQVPPGVPAKNEAYLFAHMMHGDYWRLYYSVSRICSAPSLLGPYSEPGPPVSPGFREAPTLIPSPDGRAWYLYYEQYPGVSYGLSVAAHLGGAWFQAAGATHYRDWDKYAVPAKARHGCMLPITRKQHDALVAAFPNKGGPRP